MIVIVRYIMWEETTAPEKSDLSTSFHMSIMGFCIIIISIKNEFAFKTIFEIGLIGLH